MHIYITQQTDISPKKYNAKQHGIHCTNKPVHWKNDTMLCNNNPTYIPPQILINGQDHSMLCSNNPPGQAQIILSTATRIILKHKQMFFSTAICQIQGKGHSPMLQEFLTSLQGGVPFEQFLQILQLMPMCYIVLSWITPYHSWWYGSEWACAIWKCKRTCWEGLPHPLKQNAGRGPTWDAVVLQLQSICPWKGQFMHACSLPWKSYTTPPKSNPTNTTIHNSQNHPQ